MRILGILLVGLTLFTATLETQRSCSGHDEVQNYAAMIASHDNTNESSNSNSHGCPMDCHVPNGHCHGPCLQHLNPQSLNVSLEDKGNNPIPFTDRAHPSPDLEGARKPPKAS